jgi:O-antigen/teichoic acid export membrane protein
MGSSLLNGTRIFTQIASVLRHSPGKQDTSQDRSRERYRLAALYGSATLLAKVVSVVTSLITVRLAIRYLGSERYGMWLTISSIVLMLGSADLGMSSGLVNLVADAVGREDTSGARKATASAFWLLSIIAAVLSLGMAVAYPFINPARLLNVHSALAVREAGPALLVFFYCFALNLPLGTVRGVQTGLQKGFINSLWVIAGSVLSLVALLIAIRLHAGLPILVLGLAGPPVLALLLNGVELFGWSHRDLTPTFSNFSRASASRLFRTGMMFFLLQLSLAIGMQADNVVIAQIMGAQSVASYAVPARLFNMVNVVLMMLSGTLWPAYADAFARSDVHWIRTTFRRVAITGTGITIVLTLVLIIFGNAILKIWIGPQIEASASLLAVFGLQCVLNAYLQPIAFLLNGIGKFREQVITSSLMAVVNLALSILFVRHYGIIGAVLGTVISLAVVVVIPLTLVTRHYLHTLGQNPTAIAFETE